MLRFGLERPSIENRASACGTTSRYCLALAVRAHRACWECVFSLPLLLLVLSGSFAIFLAQFSSNCTLLWEHSREEFMLYWSLVFFVVSLLAGVFGFGNIAATTAGLAQILFYVFLVFFVVTLVAGLASGGRRRIQ